MSDNLTVFGTDYTGVTGIKAKGTGNGTLTYIRPSGTKSISANGTGIDVTEYASVDVAVPSSAAPAIQPLTVTPTTAQQVFTSGNTLLGQTYCGDGATENWPMQLTDGVVYLVELSRCNSEGYVIQTYDPVEWVASTTETQLAPTSGSAYPIYVTTSTMRNAAQIPWTAKVYMPIDAYAPVTVNAIPSQYVVPTGTLAITANGTVDVTEYASASVAVPSGSTPTLQSKSATPTESAQTITPDSGYDGLSSVSVGAISSTYVGSGIDQRDSTDLTASGATVTVPAGYYASSASKSVASGSATVNSTITTTPTVSVDSSGLVTASLSGSVGAMPSVTAGYISSGTTGTINYSGSKTLQLDTQAATTITPSTSAQTAVAAGKYTTGAVTVAAMPSGTAGTPTATKGTVSNHAVSVTPSVTNATGYITGGTKTGTAVSVSASELVSGTLSITSSGTKDVTNYASASVAAGGATASATKGSVSNHSVTVTPSVTRTAGYVTAGSANGTAVTVSASELVSGSETKTDNGTYDVTNLAQLVVNIPFVTYYTSSSDPTSSQGSNGDIWLVTS